MLPETLIAQVYSIADKWKLHKVTIEVVAFQQVLVHMLRSSFARFRPIGIAEYRPRGEKKARIASMLEPYFSNRKIYVSKGLMGIPQFREEIEYFSNDPNSSMHDDFVDCMAILAEIATPSPQYKTPQRNRLVNMSVNERYGGIY
jgi:phage terminase large subunit-like protein